MILKALTLENFKGIREPVKVEFAPLTLLFGPNNAGKSTIVQALMYAREVLERNNCDAGTTQLGGDVVDLGGFQNLVHGHDLNRVIRMRFELDLTGNSLRRPTDWVREFGIELGIEGDDSTFVSLDNARDSLTGLWLELHIGWFVSRQPGMSGRPTVRRYVIGRGANEIYAEVSLQDDDAAAITNLGFGLLPFGITDYQDDTETLDWILGQLAWYYTTPIPRLSRKSVADSAAEVRAGKNRWDNAQQRETLLITAQQYYEEWLSRTKSGKFKDSNSADVIKERIFTSLESGQIVDGEMLDLFDDLIKYDRVPVDDRHVLPLRIQGTAIPELGKTFELDPRVWKTDDANGEGHVPNRLLKQEYLKDLLASLITGPAELLREALLASVYISPFREMPPRHYLPARSPDTRRWANGLAAWDLLLLEDKSFAGRVNEWLVKPDRFDSGYAIDARHYHELEIGSTLFAALTAQAQGSNLDFEALREQLLALPEGRRLTIQDQRNGIPLSPQDLGVGISQLIPVVVAALHNTSGVVAIEEPESNIHPAFQVVLADLFVSQLKANPGVIFLVETHSEHLLLRCLRRIREASEGAIKDDGLRLRPNEIAVHFVEADVSGPKIHRIRIDDDGEFRDIWPQGFFRERTKELFGDDF